MSTIRTACGAAAAWLLIAPLHASAAPPACSRACLTQALDHYYDSLAHHDAARLRTTTTVRITENGAPIGIGAGLWQRAGATAPGYRLDVVDATNEQAASNAVLMDGDKKAILFVRLKLEGRAVSEIETSIVRPGEGQRSDADAMSMAESQPYLQTVPAAQRASREQLVAAANAYFYGLKTAGTDQYRSPPLATNVFRVEDGVHAGAPPGRASALSMDDMLRKGFGTDKLYVSQRRFPVIDEQRGVVVAIGLMHVKYGPRDPSLPPSGNHAVATANRVQILVEFFKISDGLIHQIQATMLDLNDPAIVTPGWPVADADESLPGATP